MPETMTNEQIDSLVAEKVFGWTLDKRPGYGWPVPNAVVPAMKHPAYSATIAAAWSVVEKMREDDWLVVVKCNTDAARFTIEGSRSEYDAPSPDRPIGPKGSCVCELSCMRVCKDPTARWRNNRWAMADTAPRAICIAALAAVDGEGGER